MKKRTKPPPDPDKLMGAKRLTKAEAIEAGKRRAAYFREKSRKMAPHLDAALIRFINALEGDDRAYFEAKSGLKLPLDPRFLKK